MITYDQINQVLGPAPEWSFLDSCCDARLESSDTLLVTIGDSWTWGDSLGQAKARISQDDPEYRLAHVYGNLIARQLKSDWINIAIPGESNYWILNQARRLLSSDIIKSYKQVYLTLTFTEFGRKEDYYVISDNRHSVTLDNVFAVLNQAIVDQVNNLIAKYPDVKILAGYNFVDPVIASDILPDTWLDLLYQDATGKCQIVLSEHIEILGNWIHELTGISKADITQWKLQQIEQSLIRINRLDNSPYNNSEDSRHPTESGHAIWADYLLKNLT